MKPKAHCHETRAFLRINFGRTCLAPLTGQDGRALDAIAHCWELYTNSDEDGQRAALDAVRALLKAMQPSTRHLAREAIPAAANWEDRERWWPLVYPEDFELRGIPRPNDPAGGPRGIPSKNALPHPEDYSFSKVK